VIASRRVLRWRVVVRGDRERTRWLADAEAEHSGGVTRAEGGAYRPGAGAVAAKAVTLADRDAGDGARPGRDGVRAGGAGHAPQTELAESEAVSGDRTRLSVIVGAPGGDDVRATGLVLGLAVG
jgi:hypothetical protein